MKKKQKSIAGIEGKMSPYRFKLAEMVLALLHRRDQDMDIGYAAHIYESQDTKTNKLQQFCMMLDNLQNFKLIYNRPDVSKVCFQCCMCPTKRLSVSISLYTGIKTFGNI